MRNIKNTNKTGFLKKIFVKLCRVMGYEIIDQNNFYFPVSNKNNEKAGVRFPKAGGLWKSRTYRMPMSMNFG